MRYLNILAITIMMSVTATAVIAKGQAHPGADKRHCQKHLLANAEKLKADFQSLDINHDGALTRQESKLKNLSRMCFDKLDRDGNKVLSTEELSLS